MAKQKKARVEHPAVLTVMGEVAQTKAIQTWLRITDKPLAKTKRDRQDTELRDE